LDAARAQILQVSVTAQNFPLQPIAGPKTVDPGAAASLTVSRDVGGGARHPLNAHPEEDATIQ